MVLHRLRQTPRPGDSQKLRELYLKGDILEQTLVRRRGFDTWPTFIKAFPDVEQPANKKKDQAAKEKWRARIELAPKNVTHNARIGKNYTIFGGNCALTDSDSTLIMLASMSQLQPHFVHYLRTLPVVPSAFFQIWLIEGIPGKLVRLSARAASAVALADRDIILF